MRLLEREAQLSSLLQYAEEAALGRGRLVLLAGEAGVGKSSLLEELESRVDGARWAWGACDGLFTPRPLAPLVDIGGQLGGELGELLRSGAGPDRLFTALLAEVATADRPTVLVIEDVHWADEATLDLVRFLGRRLRDTRALILVTYRDDGLAADDELRIAVGEVSTQRSTRRMSLAPLSERAVAALADGTGVRPDELHRFTGGNPFFVQEVLRASDGELPTSVRDAVLARVVGLGGDARRVLEVASLVGGRTTPAFLVEVTDASATTIDELVLCGVLVGDGGRLRFRHEIARMAVQTTVLPQRAAAAHRRILDVLLQEGADDEARLAHHAEGAGDRAAVLEHAAKAGRRASELGSHREAAAQFQRAVDAAEAVDAPLVTRAELYSVLADELALVDRWADSAEARDVALSLWRVVGDRLREGDSLRRLSRTMWRLCRGPEAEAASVAACEVLEPLGPSPELAWAYANLANHRLNRGEHEDSIRLARSARDVAESLALADVLSDSLNTEACASAGLGAVWSPLLHRSLDIAKAAGLDELAGRAYANLYSMYSRSMRIAAGEGTLIEGIAYCDEHDISTFGNCLRGERTVVLERLGRWDESEALATRLMQAGAPSPVNRLNPLLSLAKIHARRGVPDATDALDEVLGLAEGLDEQEWIVLARTARAEAFWLEGQVERALDELAAAAAGSARQGAIERGALAIWRYRITGSSGHATGLIEPFATEVGGDHVRAAELWDDLGFRYDAALALLGSSDENMLRDALARLESLGADSTARLARQKMRTLGVRSVPSGVRATTKAHPAGLTRREHEVLELLCENLTNEEIAARLFLSVKTVDHHVSAVLGKLDVPSRKLAAAEAVRRGLVGART